MPEIHFPRPIIFWYLFVKFRGVYVYVPVVDFQHRQDDADVIKGRGLLVTGKMITQIWEDGHMASLPWRLSHENCKDNFRRTSIIHQEDQLSLPLCFFARWCYQIIVLGGMGNDDLIFLFSSSESECYLPVLVGSCRTMAKTLGKSGRGLNALNLQLAFRDLQVFRFDWGLPPGRSKNC